MSSLQNLVETPTRPIELLRDKIAQMDVRGGIEELAKATLGQDIGTVLTASAETGLVMLRQAAVMYLNRAH